MIKNLKVHLFAFFTVLLWGSGFPFTRIIDGQIGSYGLGAIRCILAAVIFAVIGIVTGMRKPFCKKDLLWFFAAGITGFSLYFIFFNLGLETLDSSTGSIICATTPISTSIGVYLIYKERINKTGWISMFCAFAGVVILLMWDSGISVSIGAVWMFISATLFAAYNIITRKLSELGYTAMEIVTYAAVAGAVQLVFFIPSGISDMLTADTQAVMACIYLGVFPSAIAYCLWAMAISLADRTSIATNYLFINPLIATVIGIIMLHEVPGLGTVAGGAIIIISVIVFSKKGCSQ